MDFILETLLLTPMTTPYYLFLIAVLAFSISMTIVRLMIKNPILDVPVDRSSHGIPTPRGGGLGIVVAFLLMMALYHLRDPFLLKDFALIGGASVLIAVVGLWDDFCSLPALSRWIIQMIVVVLILAMTPLTLVITPLDFFYSPFLSAPFTGKLLAGIWILGFINMFNFMDGVNGISGVTTLIFCLFLGVLSLWGGSLTHLYLAVALAAATLGFLIYNFPKGRIFLGDVGSQFLGLWIGILLLSMSQHPLPFFHSSVMIFTFFPYLFDSSFTLIRRLLNRENIFKPHRTHLYQLLNRLGFSHVHVTCLYGGLFAFHMAISPYIGHESFLFLVGSFIAYMICAGFILKAARKNHINF